ncbi:MAG: outer membrane protein assembly factor BamA [Deltaproteobacteria bacterium]|nr:outer membrane protein assembly factor BamA [Deltaproteobacteria bacterium]
MFRSFVLIFILLFPQIALAGARVKSINFVGLQSVPESSVRSRISTQEGSEYSSKIIQSDIKKLYESGLFSDVSVKKRNASGGIDLSFQLIEKRSIGKLTFKGNKKLKAKELKAALKVTELELLDMARVAETKAAIRKLYEEKGYYLVDINTEIEPFDADNNQVELIFQIKENNKVKVRRIQFIGNKAFSDSKLRKKLRSKEKGTFSFLSSSGKLDHDKLMADLQLLRFYYLDNGYLRVKVGDPTISLTRDKEAIYISIPVHEGEQFKVNSVELAGDILTTPQELSEDLSLKVGETYRKSQEMEDVNKLKAVYGDQAYAFANIIPYIEADDDSKEAKVVYYIQKGPKIMIDKVIIKGNDVTRDKVIRRELKLVENSFFSQSDLELSKLRLYQLGYFEEVNLSIPRGSKENTVDLVVEVKEKNTGTFSIGAGFSTLESFIFTATVQKENFFGRGWSGGIQANLSKLRQDIVVSMSDRYFLDTKWFFGVTFQRFQSQLNSDFDQNRFGGSVSFGRELFDFFNLRVGYQIDDVEVTNFSSQVPQFFQKNASGLTSALFGTVIYDRRDNRISTKKGFYTSGTVEWSSDYMGATNEYVKMTYDTRVFIPLPLNFVLKGRGMVGYIESTESDPVGLFNRFFLGGINTLRGYDLNSVGPELNVPQTAVGGDSSFTYGGNKMMLFNAELEIPIYAPAGIVAVAFFDAGNSFAEHQNYSFNGIKMNYGTGFRWQSPFGPLRFEWGFPINREPGRSGVVFNFTIGQSF